jgi:peroxiredoxin
MKWLDMRRLLKITTLLLLISMHVSAQKAADIIPQFNFFKLDKTEFTNKDLAKGKLIFIVFFDVSCDHCQHAITEINKYASEYKNAAVYLISLDESKKMSGFLAKYAPDLIRQKNVTLLQDLKNELITKFKPKKYPSLFLYSAQQTLILYDDDEQHVPVFLQKIKSAKK